MTAAQQEIHKHMQALVRVVEHLQAEGEKELAAVAYEAEHYLARLLHGHRSAPADRRPA